MSLIQSVQKFLAKILGWNIDIHKPTFEARIKRVCNELGFLELSNCIASLEEMKNNPKVVQAFSREFSVCETYFFQRHPIFQLFGVSYHPIYYKKKYPFFIYLVSWI
jgi:chemotaxis methyl-accepting protein methylase